LFSQPTSTLPDQPEKRENILAMRLTESEREAVGTLAERLHLPSSSLARHFLLEAVEYHRKRQSIQESCIATE
jgi:hypothetical protein